LRNHTDRARVDGAFARDIDRVTRRVRTRRFFINRWYAGGVARAFDGYDKAGCGRVALRSPVQTKNIAIRQGATA